MLDCYHKKFHILLKRGRHLNCCQKLSFNVILVLVLIMHEMFFLHRARVAQWVGLSNNSYKPITNTAWVRAGFVNYKKWCTRFAAASDKVYQLLAHGRWFSPVSSTTKTGRHDIAEILLKVALNTKKSILYVKQPTTNIFEDYTHFINLNPSNCI